MSYIVSKRNFLLLDGCCTRAEHIRRVETICREDAPSGEPRPGEVYEEEESSARRADIRGDVRDIHGEGSCLC